MSIIPASSLSSSELRMLGNNFGPARRRPQRSRPSLAAVNRSLAVVGERVSRLQLRRPVYLAEKA